MHRIDAPGHDNGTFTEGSPTGGTPATEVDEAWLDAVQEEIVAPIEATGITLVKGTNNQLLKAIRQHVGIQAGYKNFLTNARLEVWQRGTSFALSGGTAAYTADRWRGNPGTAPGALTVSRVSIPIGDLVYPEAQYVIRGNQTTGSGATSKPSILQRIEDVRTLAGRKVTLSFWAKNATGNLTVTPTFRQNFGTGGSSSVAVTGTDQVVGAGWGFFNVTVDLPTVGAQTLGTNHYLEVELVLPSGATFTIDFTLLQLERGPEATAFEFVPLADDQARCFRYYEKSYELDTAPGTSTFLGAAMGHDEGGVDAQDLNTRFRVEKRAVPTLTWYNPNTGGAGVIYWNAAGQTVTSTQYTSRAATGMPTIQTAVGGDYPVYGQWTAEAEL